MLFEDLSLSKVYKEPYMNKATNPNPIQEQSIPLVLAGKDLIGCAQTGTGKQQHLPYQLYINYIVL
jgi:ATP-dependent RNA helicase RhlE